MTAKNEVIAGICKGSKIFLTSDGKVHITGFTYITKDIINNYQIIDESYTQNASFNLGKAALGTLFFGSVGALAGLSTKSKGTHIVALTFKSGEQSLIEIDDKIYKALISQMF